MDPSSFSECTVFVGEREGEVLSRLEAVPAVAAPSSSGSLFLPGFENLDTDENEASLGTILHGGRQQEHYEENAGMGFCFFSRCLFFPISPFFSALFFLFLYLLSVCGSLEGGYMEFKCSFLCR